ncbi:MAG: FtsX-like permease family protein [Muribaculaceae bacterium]|nr:FtsX-like permease family protein [Muribaculaceae bacterium]
MLSIRIALRYLLAKKTHAAVNVISWISMAVVALASAAIVMVLSVFNGFSDLASSHLSILDPDLKINTAYGKTITDADSLSAIVKNINGVRQALPVVEERALLVDGPHQQPVVFKGVPADYDSTSGIDSAVIDGIFTTEAYGMPCATLSVGVAVATGLRPSANHPIAIYVPRRVGRIQTANPATAFRGDSLYICGVFQVNQPEYDNEHIFIPLDVARQLLDYEKEATALDVTVSPDDDIAQVQKRIGQTLGAGYTVLDRMQQQEKSFRMIAIEKWVTFMMLAFILLIASFNIISTLSMLVLEKRENLATLRALGASRNMVGKIFVWQGWLIAFIGAVIGIIVGISLTLAQQYGGFIRLNADPATLTITSYPVRLWLPDILVVVAVAAIIGLLTSRVTTYFIRHHIN